MKTATSKTKKSASTTKSKGKGGRPKKSVVAGEIIKAEKKAKKKPPSEDLKGVEPVKKGEKKPNLGQRTAMARHLDISTQTLYNREKVFGRHVPDYAAGLSLLAKKGEALKELPDLTPFQQFCHLQFQKIRKGLPVYDCTPNEQLVLNNLSIFKIDFFEKQQQLESAIVDVKVTAETETQFIDQ